MRKNLLPLILLAALEACHDPNGRWLMKNKWTVTDEDRRPLSGRPRQVTEYSGMAHDTLKPEKRKFFYVRYGFDDEGDPTFKGTYMNDSLVMRRDMKIDENGIQEHMTVISTGTVTGCTTQRLADGRYKSVYRDHNHTSTVTIYSFPSGQEEIQEKYDDTAAPNKRTGIAHFYYSGDRIVKITGTTRDGSDVEERYFYSRWEAPDSILTYNMTPLGKQMVEREIFQYNEHSDPVLTLMLTGKDTSDFEKSAYRYDPKGNWIRRISTSRKNKVPDYLTSEANVTDREIEY